MPCPICNGFAAESDEFAACGCGTNKESEEEAYSYAYNEGHADSRKREPYKPNLTSKGTKDFNKVLRQRAEGDLKKMFDQMATIVSDIKCDLCSWQGDNFNYHIAYDCPGTISHRDMLVNAYEKDFSAESFEADQTWVELTTPFGTHYVCKKNKKTYKRTKIHPSWGEFGYPNAVCWNCMGYECVSEMLKGLPSHRAEWSEIDEAHALLRRKDKKARDLARKAARRNKQIRYQMGAETFDAHGSQVCSECKIYGYWDDNPVCPMCRMKKNAESFEADFEAGPWAKHRRENPTKCATCDNMLDPDEYRGVRTGNRCEECRFLLRWDAQYAGPALMGITGDTDLSSFTPDELTKSSAIHGDFDTASIDYSGKQNLEVRSVFGAESFNPKRKKKTKNEIIEYLLSNCEDYDEYSDPTYHTVNDEQWTIADLFIRQKLNNDCDGFGMKNVHKVYDYLVENKEQLIEYDLLSKDGINNSGFPLWNNYDFEAETFEAYNPEQPRDNEGRWTKEWTDKSETPAGFAEEMRERRKKRDLQYVGLPTSAQPTLRELAETMMEEMGIPFFDLAYKMVQTMLSKHPAGDTPETREILLESLQEIGQTLQYVEDTDYDYGVQVMVDMLRQVGMEPPADIEEQVQARIKFEDEWAAETFEAPNEPQVPDDYTYGETFGRNLVLLAEGSDEVPMFGELIVHWETDTDDYDDDLDYSDINEQAIQVAYDDLMMTSRYTTDLIFKTHRSPSEPIYFEYEHIYGGMGESISVAVSYEFRPTGRNT